MDYALLALGCAMLLGLVFMDKQTTTREKFERGLTIVGCLAVLTGLLSIAVN